MKTINIIEEILDLGFEGKSQRKNVLNKWNYTFTMGASSSFGLVVFTNDNQGFIWTESGYLFGEKKIPKKGQLYNDFNGMLEDIKLHAQRHPMVFTTFYDKQRRDLERELADMEMHLDMEFELNDVKEAKKDIAALKRKLNKHINNPKIIKP